MDSEFVISIRQERAVSLADLLLSVAIGDRQAFGRLYEVTKAKVYGICFGMLRDRELANEVFQEAFVKIWEKAGSYDPAKGEAIAWMTTITRHCVLDRKRRRNMLTVTLDEIDPDSAELAIAPLASSTGSGRDLKRCLDRLKPDQAKAIVLAFVYGLTHDELARKMMTPLGTVKSWVRRGLSDLKDCLSDDS